MNVILRKTQVLARVGLVDEPERLMEVLSTVLDDAAHEFTADAVAVSKYWAAYYTENEEMSSAAKGLKIFQQYASDAAIAMVELNPQRDIKSQASVDTVFRGEELAAHLQGRYNTQLSADAGAFIEVGHLETVTDGTVEHVGTGASMPHGMRVVSVMGGTGGLATGTVYDILRPGTSRVDIEFNVRIIARASAQALFSTAISDVDGTVDTVQGTFDLWLVTTEANHLAWAQTVTLGGELPSSVHVDTQNNQIIAYLTYVVSATGATIALGGATIHADADTAEACFIEILPTTVTYRGDNPVFAYDTNGDSVVGREVGDLIGLYSPTASKSVGVSDSTRRFLRFLAMCNRLQLRNNGSGGSNYAFSNLMDDILEDVLDIADGTLDSDIYFSFARLMSNDSSLTDAQMQQVYSLWYKQIPVYLGIVLSDKSLAKAFATEFDRAKEK